MKLFAYGSNLCRHRLRRRVPGAAFLALLPFTWYLRYVRVGAAERGLPAAYRRRLEAQPCRPDPDRSRARDHLLVPAGLA